MSVKPTIAFRNDSAETVPSFGLMRLTGTEIIGGQVVRLIAKPSTAFCPIYYINGPTSVRASGKGTAYSLGSECPVAYDTGSGTPALNEHWGAKPGEWKAFSGYPGLIIQGTGASGKVWVKQYPIQEMLGKTDAAIAKGASGTVSMWVGIAGSEVDSTIDLTTCYNRFADVAITKWVLVRIINGQKYLAAAEC